MRIKKKIVKRALELLNDYRELIANEYEKLEGDYVTNPKKNVLFKLGCQIDEAVRDLYTRDFD